MSFLETEGLRKGERFMIRGAPGIGKTLATWAHSCKLSCKDSKVDVVHSFFLKDKFRGAVHLCGGKIVKCWNLRIGTTLAIDGIVNLLKEEHSDAVFVIDGVTTEAASSLGVINNGWIAVSSTGCRFTTDATENHEVTCCVVDSWREEEYVTALKGSDDVVREAVLKDKEHCFPGKHGIDGWVRGKYYFCGGSARMMFSKPLGQCKQAIMDALTNLQSADALLDGGALHSTQTLVSTLCQSFGGMYFPLSKYVLDCVRRKDKLTRKFIRDAMARGKEIGGGAFLGWIHEYSMLIQLSETKNIEANSVCWALESLDNAKNAKMVLQVSREETFERLEKLSLEMDLDSRVLLVPESHSNGCFDAAIAYYKPNRRTPVLVTLQATVSKTHDWKSEFIALLLESLLRDKGVTVMSQEILVWHVFVLKDAQQFAQFRCPDAVKHVGRRKKWMVKVEFWKMLLPSI